MPAGAPCQESWGDLLAPPCRAHACSEGIRPPAANDALESVSAAAPVLFVAVIAAFAEVTCGVFSEPFWQPAAKKMMAAHSHAA